MIALPHRRHVEPPPPAKLCGSDATFMVRSGAEDTDVCAAHFPKLLIELRGRRDESPVYWEIEPGRKCFYKPGVSR